MSVVARGNAGVTVEVGPIDTKLLKDQIEDLIDLIIEDGDSPLWGLVSMLEDIVDSIEMDRLMG